jgi:hypothetical protein
MWIGVTLSRHKDKGKILTTNGCANLVKSLHHSLFPLGLFLISLNQSFLSLFIPGLCCLSSLLSRNLGSVGILMSFGGGFQFSFQCRYASKSRVRAIVNKKTISTIVSQKNASREAVQKKRGVKEKPLDALVAS